MLQHLDGPSSSRLHEAGDPSTPGTSNSAKCMPRKGRGNSPEVQLSDHAGGKRDGAYEAESIAESLEHCNSRGAGPNTKPKKFNVQEARSMLTAEHCRAFSKQIQISTLNARCLRTSNKKESLKEMTNQLRFSPGIITETHLLDDEAAALEIAGYRVIAKKGFSTHKGEVLILAREGAFAFEHKLVDLPPRPIDACARLPSTAGDDSHEIRITGIYVPPFN